MQEDDEDLLNSSYDSTDQAYFSHNTSNSLSTDIEAPSFEHELRNRILQLANQNQSLNDENRILLCTNARLSTDLENINCSIGPQGGILANNQTSNIAFMQMELEARESIITELKQTVAKQYSLLQEPNKELTKSREVIRNLKLDVEFSRKSEQWALSELHRCQQLKNALSEQLLAQSQVNRQTESRADQLETLCEEQRIALAKHTFNLQASSSKPTVLSVICQTPVKVQVENNLLCSDCNKHKNEAEDLSEQLKLSQQVCRETEANLISVHKDNKRLQSELIIAETSLKDHIILLDTFKDYLNRLEKSSEIGDKLNNDLKTQLNIVHCQLSEAQQIQKSSDKARLTLESSNQRLKLQLQSTRDILDRVKLEKNHLIQSLLVNYSDQFVDIPTNANINIANPDLKHSTITSLCQIDVIDFKFTLLTPKAQLYKTLPNAEPQTNYKILLKVLQTEFDEKQKRHSIHVRSLITKAAQYLRAHSRSAAECAQLFTQIANVQADLARNSVALKLQNDELFQLRHTKGLQTKCIEQLQLSVTQLAAQLKTVQTKHTNELDMQKQLRAFRQRDAIRMKCETVSYKQIISNIW